MLIQNLYVGVTRVRSRLWILESNANAVNSVIKLFNKTAPGLFPEEYREPLIEVIREHEPEVCLMLLLWKNSNNCKAAGLRERFRSTNKTSPTRWIQLAYEFMTNKDFCEVSTFATLKKLADRLGLRQAFALERRITQRG